jgi:hypothetical protein
MSLGKVSIAVEAAMAGFESDMGRAARIAEKEFKRISAAAKRNEAEIKAAGKAIGLFIAAGATAATYALKQSINAMDDMSKAAQKVGASTEEFSKLTYAAGLADVSMDTLVGSLGKLTKAQASAMSGTGAQADVFNALGIAVKNADGSMRESTDVLADFADQFKTLKGSPEAMAAGFAIFGRSFQEMIPLLKDGGDGIRAAGDELEEFGGVLSTEAGRQAEEFNDNLTRLETAARSLAMQVASDLLPDLVALTDNWVTLSKDGETLSETATGIANVFRVVGGVAEFVGGYLKALDNVIQGTTIGFVGLAEAAKGVINLNWDQIKRGISVANGGADLAYYGTDPEAPSKPKTKAGKSRRGGGAMQYTPGYDPTAALRLALEDAKDKPKGSSGGGGSGVSAAAKEAEQLLASYDRLAASMAEQIALFGVTGEAAKVRYDLENGELAKLSEAQKSALITQAEKIDAMKLEKDLQDAAAKVVEQETKAYESHQEAVAKQLDDMEFENSLIGLNNEAREKAIALRWAGVDAMSAEGQRMQELIDQNYKLHDSYGFVNDTLDGLGEGMVALATRTKTAEEAFGDWADQIYATAVQWLADQAMNSLKDWLSGKQDGNGGYGGGKEGGGFDFGSLLSSVMGFFGGGRAAGGPVSGSRFYEVGEKNRPEILRSRGKSYLIPGNDGAVMPMRGGGGVNQTMHFHYAAPYDARTESQKNARLAFETSRASSRSR